MRLRTTRTTASGRGTGCPAALGNTIVISSVGEAGRPSSRLMRFVRSDRPGVWYVVFDDA